MGAAVECRKFGDQEAVLGRPDLMRGTMIFEKRNFQLFICFYQKVDVYLHIATILTSHTHHEENQHRPPAKNPHRHCLGYRPRQCADRPVGAHLRHVQCHLQSVSQLPHPPSHCRSGHPGHRRHWQRSRQTAARHSGHCLCRHRSPDCWPTAPAHGSSRRWSLPRRAARPHHRVPTWSPTSRSTSRPCSM